MPVEKIGIDYAARRAIVRRLIIQWSDEMVRFVGTPDYYHDSMGGYWADMYDGFACGVQRALDLGIGDFAVAETLWKLVMARYERRKKAKNAGLIGAGGRFVHRPRS